MFVEILFLKMTIKLVYIFGLCRYMQKTILLLSFLVCMCSVVGMILLFSGLYVVLWAKKKETTIINSDDSSMAVATKDGDDPEKQPLLSRRH